MDGDGVNERTLIDCMGLKTLFAAFMMKETRKKKKKKKTSKEKAKASVEITNDDEEHIISCIAKLFIFFDSNCESSEDAQRYARLVHKFCENDFEKVNRLIEMHIKHSQRVRQADAMIEQTILEQLQADETYDPTEDEMTFLGWRLESGLLTLQLTDLVIAFVGTCPGEIAVREQGFICKRSRSVLWVLPNAY